jgi:nucleotide-binding universal stress UspA family protein
MEAAVKLAELDGGHVAAVIVVDREDESLPDSPDEVHRQADELLQTAGNFARSRGVLLTPIVREGDPANTIIECAKEEEATLVVLGANGEARAGDLGDTAEEVTRLSPCAVLVVR